MVATTKSPSYAALGPLAKLGPREPWHVALLLPESYEDYRSPVASAHDLDQATPKPIALTLVSRPSPTYKKGIPRLTFAASDATGTPFPVTIFGDAKLWASLLAEVQSAVFMAKASPFGNRLYLTVTDLVDPVWQGRIRPRYPSAGRQMPPAAVRDLVLRHLPAAVAPAVERIREAISPLAPLEDILYDLGGAGWTIEQVLMQAHLPVSLEHAQYANRLARRLAACASLVRMGSAPPAAAPPLPLRTLAARVGQLPGTPTGCQQRAFARIAALMAAPHAGRLLIAGDVGVGKSWTIFVALAATADAGGRAMLLAPNLLLAKQLHAEFQDIYPDLTPQLVTSEQDVADLSAAQLLIGTTALLHRDIGGVPFTLVVCDEQHRMARSQREARLAPTTRLIELSATPIPRTQALMRFGAVEMVEMRECSAPKTFISTLYEGRAGAVELMEVIRPLVRSGDTILVVLPKRGELQGPDLLGDQKAADSADDRHSVHASFQRWDAVFPGYVRTLTGADDDDTKSRVLDEVRNRKARILLCTSVVEVGLNIPALAHIVIVCPERFGLTALHQLRGRTARKGGEGFCHLLCPNPITAAQRERLTFFCSCSDGFEISNFDLSERGAGDLAPDSDRQSGADESLLFGIPTSIEDLADALPVFDIWRGRREG